MLTTAPTGLSSRPKSSSGLRRSAAGSSSTRRSAPAATRRRFSTRSPRFVCSGSTATPTPSRSRGSGSRDSAAASSSFAETSAISTRCSPGFRPPDGILADLGVSSMQIDRAERGFSFRRDGPLDMRMGREGGTAADVVSRASVEELTRIFREYGEEWMAAKIARGIVSERTSAPITSTRQLARIVANAKGSREKIDPATRVFQALRIEVNQELVALSRFLAAAVERLNARGRLAILSYHSLEDRMVKEAFKRDSGVCSCPPRLPTCVCGARRVLRVLTRRPISATEAERLSNPRSRSARMRVAEKLSEAEAAQAGKAARV